MNVAILLLIATTSMRPGGDMRQTSMGVRLAPSGAAWTPAALGTNLALWLDADDASTITLNGSNVSQWSDKSGNNRNATQATAASQPLYSATGFNGKPTVENVSGDTLAFAVTTLGRNVSGITCAIVGEHPALATFLANSTEIFLSSGGGGLSTRFGMSPNYNAGGATPSRYAIGGRRLDADSFSTVSSSTDSLANRGNPWIRIGQRAYSAGVANHWTNGTQDLTAAAIQTAGNTSDTNSGGGSLFAGSGAVPNGTKLSEIVLTHSTMTTEDRQKLEGYLAHKWGLTYALPNDHPYKWDTSLFGGTNQDGFDADAKTYIAAVETSDGQDLEPSVRAAINDFVVGCKADDIWDAIKASAILAGARTLTGALVSLKGTAPTNFNFVSGDYNRTTGLVGNGTTKYLDSNRDNTADPQDSQHMCVYPTVVNTANADRVYMGTGFTETGSTYFFTRAIDAVARNRSGTADTGLTRGVANALIGTSRDASAAFTYRQSGSSLSVTRASQAPASGNVFVYQSNGYSAFSDARLAFYSIGESLDLALLDARVTTLINAYAAAIP